MLYRIQNNHLYFYGHTILVQLFSSTVREYQYLQGNEFYCKSKFFITNSQRDVQNIINNMKKIFAEKAKITHLESLNVTAFRIYSNLPHYVLELLQNIHYFSRAYILLIFEL